MTASQQVLKIALLLGLFAQTARGDFVTFGFEGTVTDVDDPDNHLGGAVVVGSPFSGFYTFDSETPDSRAHPKLGFYEDVLTELEGQVGGLSFVLAPASAGYITIENGYSGFDIEEYFAEAKVVADDLLLYWEFWALQGDGGVLQEDALLLKPDVLLGFEEIGFGLSDPSESLNIRFFGDVSDVFVVPEPTLIMLFGVGTVLAVSRRATKKPSGRRRRLSCAILILSWQFGGVSFAIDCNENGVDDDDEVVACPAIEIVAMMDTSTSMTTAIQLSICTEVYQAVQMLIAEGRNVEWEMISIWGNGSCLCDLCEEDDPSALVRYDAAPVQIGVDCDDEGEYNDGEYEDWGVATRVVAAEKEWTPGSIRIVIPISDEGPRCGGGHGNGGAGNSAADRAEIDAAVYVIQEQHVLVIPILVGNQINPPDQLILPLAHNLARGYEPGTFALLSTDPLLAERLAYAIGNTCPSDCDGDGVLDECEIRDCEMNQTDCRDCNRNWTPDSCDPDQDCNMNGKPDICDIAEGTLEDCNGNEIDDDCEDSVIFVDDTATGNETGGTWTNAFHDLQDALRVARLSNPCIEKSQVWVAEGTYRPAPPAGNPSVSFEVVDDLPLYGGFAATETELDQRIPGAHQTILSGDLDGDEPYGDFTVTGMAATNARSFQPGIATVDPFASTGGANTKYYHSDHIGTTRRQSNVAGSGTDPAVYTAFGERISGTNHRYGYAGAWGYQAHIEAPYLHISISRSNQS